MEIGAGANQASGRATDALEAIIRRLRASEARPPPPLRCALAKTPNNPCYREATIQRGNPAAKLAASAAYAAKTLQCQLGEKYDVKEVRNSWACVSILLNESPRARG
jgi:hypothetical protein